MLVYWLALVAIGYAAMYWAIGAGAGIGTPPPGGALTHDIIEAIRLSGSSLLTLGFAASDATGATLLIFSEAILGLILIALLISYLPTIYSAFSRRELLVNLLEVRADTPPSPVVMLTRFDRLHGLDELHDMWLRWEQWFAEVEETHTSLPILSLYRSQRSELSWVNAAGAIMDAAALTRSVVDLPMDVQADLCIRAGYLALQRISDFFGIPYPANPKQDDPTSITRARFDEVCAVLEGGGRPTEGGSRAGLARLQRLARQLRRGAARRGSPGHGPALLVGPTDHLGLCDGRAGRRRRGGRLRGCARPTEGLRGRGCGCAACRASASSTRSTTRRRNSSGAIVSGSCSPPGWPASSINHQVHELPARSASLRASAGVTKASWRPETRSTGRGARRSMTSIGRTTLRCWPTRASASRTANGAKGKAGRCGRVKWRKLRPTTSSMAVNGASSTKAMTRASSGPFQDGRRSAQRVAHDDHRAALGACTRPGR